MTRILHRATRQTYPTAVAGDGPYLIDQDGKRYLDASGGAAVSCLGHSRRDVVEAIQAQLDRLPYAHTAFFTNQPSEELAEYLTSQAPDGLTHVYFVSGGSEANETALKLARQAAVERGEGKRTQIIARHQSYHGNTLGALGASGNPGRRRLYGPLLADNVHFIDPCYAYRHQAEGERDADYAQRAADQLEAKLQELGPDNVLAFIAEPVVGATLGAVPAVDGYLKRIREICDRHGVTLILDEVMCGMGRTGTLYACRQDGVAPDILTCAKGLGAGYQPVGAVLMSQAIYDTIAGGSGAFQHGFTYIGHPTACAGALAVQRAIARDDLLANVAGQGDKLRADLSAQFGNHPHVGDIRGRGLFVGLELVADRATRAPFEPADKLHARIKSAAFARGLICYPNGGTADGARGDHVLLAPPYILADGHREELVEKLQGAIADALDQIKGMAA
ncbi:aspartate aminotransferase family protein [Rhodovibrio sodomensis]|uniref:Aspartate aminotransferase family protein n=1 Tax=Rhodovibrio sodomensis TaxID=1088 RepID=A0ABS1D8Q9_9PROT|nr:aspartate aminotransferase family protein [Rhodovibrio sodomensis]MBK1666796.1 aspartate aminotransferase family protein [Rhodovibrio sodomensis]